MLDDDGVRRLDEVLGTLLDYPVAQVAELAQEAAALVAADCPEAAAALLGFRQAARDKPLGELEEIYTETFELDSERSLYVGYHLLGESYKRSLLLLGLKERYAARNFETGAELPDHLGVMLRYLSQTQDPASARELIEEALLPGLDKLLGPPQAPEEGEAAVEEPRSFDIYGPLLRALKQILEWQAHAQAAAAEAGVA